MIGRLRRAYGEGPLHLVSHLVLLAATGYAVLQLSQAKEALNIFVWLIGAALLHDLVFLPAYTAADRALRVLPRARVPIINHVRVAVLVPGVLLLVWFPLILDEARGNYVRAAGHEPADYLGRWLAISAGVAVLSALVYVARAVRARRVEQRHHAVGAPADEHSAGA